MLTDAARLAAVRGRFAAIAPADWSRVHGGDVFIEARGPMGERLPVLRFDPGASADEIDFVTHAPDDVGFLLELVDRAISFASRAASAASPPGAPVGRRTTDGGQSPASREDRSPPHGDPAPAGPKNFAAECAMKCDEPPFRVFLEERHGLDRPLTDERVAQKVRSLLGVVSRAELNRPGQAAERWKALRADFDAWRRAGR